MGDILGAIVPTLGKAIMGDFGGALNEGLKAFGISSSGNSVKDRDAFDEALKVATPEQLKELKRIEHEYKIRMKEAQIDINKIFLSDRASAREMRVKTNSYVSDFVGVAIIAGFFGVLFLFFMNPTIVNRALDIMLGSLGTMATAVVGFYYGSSNSSRSKDDKIATMEYPK